MKKLFITVGVSALGVLLTTGALASAHTGTIDTTGPDSDNSITSSTDMDFSVDNQTDINADVSASQSAESGEATVRHNTEGGSAETGDAENDNSLDAEVMVDNSGSSDFSGWLGGIGGDVSEGSISRTGPDSDNSVDSETNVDVEIDNDVDIDFTTSVSQSATTGNARVSDNTEGGNATTGSASNTSSTSVSFSVMN